MLGSFKKTKLMQIYLAKSSLTSKTVAEYSDLLVKPSLHSKAKQPKFSILLFGGQIHACSRGLRMECASARLLPLGTPTHLTMVHWALPQSASLVRQ